MGAVCLRDNGLPVEYTVLYLRFCPQQQQLLCMYCCCLVISYQFKTFEKILLCVNLLLRYHHSVLIVGLTSDVSQLKDLQLPCDLGGTARLDMSWTPSSLQHFFPLRLRKEFVSSLWGRCVKVHVDNIKSPGAWMKTGCSLCELFYYLVSFSAVEEESAIVEISE